MAGSNRNISARQCMARSATAHTSRDAIMRASSNVSATSGGGAVSSSVDRSDAHARATTAATGAIAADGGVVGGETLSFVVLARALRSGNYNKDRRKDKMINAA